MIKTIKYGVAAAGGWVLVVYPLVTWSPIGLGRQRSLGAGAASGLAPGTQWWWMMLGLLALISTVFTVLTVRALRGHEPPDTF